MPTASRSRRAGRRALAVAGLPIGALIALLSLVALAGLGCGSGSATDSTAASARTPAQPNIVVLQVDDQTLAQMSRQYMPKTERFLGKHGTTFTDYTVSTPQCCPSRTALITGAYGHNTGVTSNGDLSGFVDPSNIMPANLQDAGYVTAHIGKYLVNYKADSSIPAGWTKWYTRIGAERSPYYNYDMAVNGHIVHEGDRPRNYSTRVFTRYATHVASKYMNGHRPLYMQVDYSAPHSAPEKTIRAALGGPRCGNSPLPDQRDLGDYRGLQSPRPPSYDERNVADKPPFLRSLPHLDPHAKRHISKKWDCTLASLRGVDRSVGQIRDAVRKAGALRDTIFVYTSDNGYFFGEHRLEVGKVLPYEEAVHLPLLMRVPPGYLDHLAPSKIHVPVQNIDLAPTFVQWAGACQSGSDCRVMDGRSLVPLLGGAERGFRRRPELIEYDQSPSSKHGVCAYTAVRTRSQLYARYTQLVDPKTGKCAPSNVIEHYDIARDPYELHNLHPAPTGSRAAAEEMKLRAELARLEDCAGVQGRDPTPASGHYCS